MDNAQTLEAIATALDALIKRTDRIQSALLIDEARLEEALNALAALDDENARLAHRLARGALDDLRNARFAGISYRDTALLLTGSLRS